MKTSIYTRHRFHPDVIRRAVWMYFRFNLSFRDVEELMIKRGVEVSYETVRRWVDKFGSTYAKRLRSRSESPSPVWHLDEVYESCKTITQETSEEPRRQTYENCYR